MIVVRVPAPAITGNAMGTTVPARASFSCLNISCPKTISSPNKNMTMEPPMAKELMVTPNSFKNGSPQV